MKNSDTQPLKLSLDKLITSRLLIQANSGGGKSHMIRYLAETYHGEVQQIIIDREGEFSTLREKFEYLLVGPGGDIAADIRSAKLLAKKLMELRLSAIIDLSEMSLGQQKLYVQAFIEAINHLQRPFWHDCLIVIDEAHLFAPEKGKGSSAAGEAIAMLLSIGRKRGYCAILATQRLAKLDKDCAAECLNKLIGRTSNEDARRAAEELNQGKEARLALRSLEYDFWGYGPAIAREPVLMRAGKNATSEPKRGSARRAAPAPQAAIQKVLAELADLPKEAEDEAQSVANMQREIVNLRRELSTLAKTQVIRGVDPKQLEAAIAKSRREMLQQAKTIQTEIKSQTGRLMKVRDSFQDCLVNFIAIGESGMFADEPSPITNPTPESTRRTVSMMAAAPMTVRHQMGEAIRSTIEQKILNSIAALNLLGIDPVLKESAAIFAGYKIHGHFNNALGKMRSAGLIDYPAPGHLALTAEGSTRADPGMHPVKSLSELHAVWFSKFSGLRRLIVEHVINEYPREFTKEELAREINYEVSGHFNNELGKIRKFGIITKRGPIKATDLLFPPGLK